MVELAICRSELEQDLSTTARLTDIAYADRVQVSPDGRTVWVHADDGSTVGRFSKVFGMDVHTTITEQLAGVPQCLKCTHGQPGPREWNEFCELMKHHYGIDVDRSAVSF